MARTITIHTSINVPDNHKTPTATIKDTIRRDEKRDGRANSSNDLTAINVEHGDLEKSRSSNNDGNMDDDVVEHLNAEEAWGIADRYFKMYGRTEHTLGIEEGHKIVDVPPGKLGVVIEFVREHGSASGSAAVAVVKAISPNCAVKDAIQIGDCIATIGGVTFSKVEQLQRAGDDRVRRLGIISMPPTVEVDVFLRGRGCLTTAAGTSTDVVEKASKAQTIEASRKRKKIQQPPTANIDVFLRGRGCLSAAAGTSAVEVEKLTNAQNIEASTPDIAEMFLKAQKLKKDQIIEETEAKRKKFEQFITPPPIKRNNGFDLIADKLDASFYEMMLHKPPPTTATGNLNTALKRLKTSFSASLNGASKNGTTKKHVAPKKGSNHRTRLSTRSLPTSKSCKTLSPPNDDKRRGQQIRLDHLTTLVSSKNFGMKRLKLSQIVRLRKFDEFTLIVPPSNNKQPKMAIQPRMNVKRDFRSVILSAAPRGLSQSGEEEHYIKDMMERTVFMEGKEHFEYNVRIVNYPERDELENTKSDVKGMLGEGWGIYLELIGYGSTKLLLLPLAHLPYFQVYIRRESNAPFLDESVEFPRTMTKKKALTRLVQELYARKGDPVAYVQIMMNYYRQKYNTTTLALTKSLLATPERNVDNQSVEQQEQVQQDIYDPHWEQLFYQLMLHRASNNGSFAIPRSGRNCVYCEIDLGHGKNQMVNIGWFVRDLRTYKQILSARGKSTHREDYIERADSILTPDRMKVLDSVGFIWSQNEGMINNARWEERYNELVQHHAQHANCEPKNNTRLNAWIQQQRCFYHQVTGTTTRISASAKRGDKAKELHVDADAERKQLSDPKKKVWEERRAKLDKLEFLWVIRKRVCWEDRFEMLKQYKAEHGHCDVPKRKDTVDETLGRWCSKNRLEYLYYTQGKEESTMTDMRIELLESIGFNWWVGHRRPKVQPNQSGKDKEVEAPPSPSHAQSPSQQSIQTGHDSASKPTTGNGEEGGTVIATTH